MPFSYNPKEEEAINKLVESDYLEKLEISYYAAPIVPVLKNNSVHVCSNFQKINQILHDRFNN